MKGVSMHRGKWKAHIRIDGKSFNLGTFETEEAAARTYDLHAAQLERPLNFSAISVAATSSKAKRQRDEDVDTSTKLHGNASSSSPAVHQNVEPNAPPKVPLLKHRLLQSPSCRGQKASESSAAHSSGQEDVVNRESDAPVSHPEKNIPIPEARRRKNVQILPPTEIAVPVSGSYRCIQRPAICWRRSPHFNDRDESIPPVMFGKRVDNAVLVRSQDPQIHSEWLMLDPPGLETPRYLPIVRFDATFFVQIKMRVEYKATDCQLRPPGIATVGSSVIGSGNTVVAGIPQNRGTIRSQFVASPSPPRTSLASQQRASNASTYHATGRSESAGNKLVSRLDQLPVPAMTLVEGDASAFDARNIEGPLQAFHPATASVMPRYDPEADSEPLRAIALLDFIATLPVKK